VREPPWLFRVIAAFNPLRPSLCVENRRSILQAGWLQRERPTLNEDLMKRCAKCGEEFGCGLQQNDGACWCADLPKIVPLTGPNQDCLCPECLKREVAAQHGKKEATR
jgi:hypothetical protein